MLELAGAPPRPNSRPLQHDFYLTTKIRTSTLHSDDDFEVHHPHRIAFYIHRRTASNILLSGYPPARDRTSKSACTSEFSKQYFNPLHKSQRTDQHHRLINECITAVMVPPSGR
jgi:hypothetical protein